jgi:hypothetical protein
MRQPSRLAYIDWMRGLAVLTLAMLLLSLLRTGWPQWRLRMRRDGDVSA